jgi:hypothetical protein
MRLTVVTDIWLDVCIVSSMAESLPGVDTRGSIEDKGHERAVLAQTGISWRKTVPTEHFGIAWHYSWKSHRMPMSYGVQKRLVTDIEAFRAMLVRS